MHHQVAFLAFLAATPLVAQWTVSTYAGGAVPLVPPTSAGVGDVTLSLDPTASVVVANQFSHVVWRFRAGSVAERIAGTGDPGFGGDGGPATQAQLHAPKDAQMDAAGNVYFFDSLNYRIRRIDPQGIITTVAGTGQPWVPGLDREGPATSRSLSGLANFTVTSTGAFYFTEHIFSDEVWDQYQIRRVNTSGQLEIFAGVLDPSCGRCLDGDSVPALSAHLKGPQSLTFDSVGNLYVADTFRYTVLRRISPDGVVTRIAGNYEGPQIAGQTFEGQAALSAHLDSLSSLVFDLSGNIYFVHNSDFDRGRLIQIRANGTFHILHEADWSVYMDAAGRLLYVHSGSTGITIFNFVDESFLAFIPQSPVTSVEPPDGTPAANVRVTGLLAMSRSGELHFLNDCRSRILKFDRDGLLRTVADGACIISSFVRATSMVFDSQDRLWVLNNRGGISRLSSDGTFVLQYSASVFPRPPFQQIALDAQDRLYVSDGWASSVIRVEADGTVRQIGSGSGSLGNDANGNVYITNPGGIYRVLDDGSLSLFLPVSFGCERMSVDTSRGRVWCGLSFADATGVYNLGLRGGYAGDGGPVQSARFEDIEGFARGPDGSIYVSDNGRVRKVTPGYTPTPVISSGGIVNSASYTRGAIAPGELISIFGFNFGAAIGGVEVGQAANNVLPSAVGRTKVLFGSIEAKITAVTPNQINVFVPYGVAPGTLVDIVVLVDDTPSGPVRVAVVEQAFDLFALDASGSGQGAIINQNGSLNGPANPALRGTIVSLWGTGEGRTFPALPDGALVISTPYSKPNVPVTVRIGGVDAEVLYAGAAPTLPTGAFQINARIPLSIPPGNASVSVTVGTSTTTRTVTVAVQ